MPFLNKQPPLSAADHYDEGMRLLGEADTDPERAMPNLMAAIVHMIGYVGQHIQEADDQVVEQAARTREAFAAAATSRSQAQPVKSTSDPTWFRSPEAGSTA